MRCPHTIYLLPSTQNKWIYFITSDILLQITYFFIESMYLWKIMFELKDVKVCKCTWWMIFRKIRKQENQWLQIIRDRIVFKGLLELILALAFYNLPYYFKEEWALTCSFEFKGRLFLQNIYYRYTLVMHKLSSYTYSLRLWWPRRVVEHWTLLVASCVCS